MKAIVVLDRVNLLQRHPRLRRQGGHATVLSLTPRHDQLRSLSKEIARSFESLEVVHGAKHLDQIALDLRHEYAALVASAAEKIKVRDTTLRLAYCFESRLSLWWLNEIFGKRSDLYPGFTRLCQVELIRSLITREKPRELWLMSEDAPFRQVVRDLCQVEGIGFRGARPSLMSTFLAKSGLPRVVISSLAWFARVLLQTLLARAVSRAVPSAATDALPLCLFHTIYPSLWSNGKSETDEKYGIVPQLLKKQGRYRAAYACTFSSDGKHQHVTVRQFWRLCRWFRAKRSGLDELPIFLVDAYPRFRDLVATAAQLRLIVSYWRLERSRSYRRHWSLRGIAFHPLLREELRAAMVRTPRYLLHALRIRRLVEELRPQGLVYYHFEFGFGRAIAFGALTGSPETALIGAQEGPIARLKMWSLNYPGELQFGDNESVDFISSPPLPDLALLQGTGALERLTEAGYPRDRLRVVGAPRILPLTKGPRGKEKAPRRPCDVADQSATSVLVVLGAHDGDSILNAILPALTLGPKLHVVLKPHPRSGLSEQDVARMIGTTPIRGESARASVTVATGNIYRLIAEADLVVATYSMVAMEAAALGYPLICLILPDRVTASPLLDVDTQCVQFVATPSELLAALERHRESGRGDLGQSGPDLAEYFFHRLDGSSPQRWAKAISDYLGARASNLQC